MYNQSVFFSIAHTNGRITPLAKLGMKSKCRIYADVPHRYFKSVDRLADYAKSLSEIGVNVFLLLPHFLPSFSEYVVKNYELPCSFFSSWGVFAEFMKFVESQGMDRMIDIPFNHADHSADNLDPVWYAEHESGGIEAGADDVDADGNRIRVNWGAYILDNSKSALQQYWLEKVIFPHIENYNVNSIRIDAAWGLNPDGLSAIVRGTLKRRPDVWFLAENLGMDRLFNLASSSIRAGAHRFFNNIYWYSGGRYIPSDMYRFYKQSHGVPTCAIFSSHDVLMPAMKSLATVRRDSLGTLNDKALHREVVDRNGIVSLKQLSSDEQVRVIRLMKLDFLLSALISTDLMFVAGAERGLLEKFSVSHSSPEHFERGCLPVPCGTGDDGHFGMPTGSETFAGFMKDVLAIKKSDNIFASEGVLIPFGFWERNKIGCKGFVKKANGRLLFAVVNTDLQNPSAQILPEAFLKQKLLMEVTPAGFRKIRVRDIKRELLLPPGKALILITEQQTV